MSGHTDLIERLRARGELCTVNTYQQARDATLMREAADALADAETDLAKELGFRWRETYRARDAEDERDRLADELAYAKECGDNMQGWASRAEEKNRELRAERDRLADELAQARAALERIKGQQPKTVETLRSNGIVFDGPLGNDPKNWQHVAFSIYTDLCEVDMWAGWALEEDDAAEGEGAGQTALTVPGADSAAGSGQPG